MSKGYSPTYTVTHARMAKALRKDIGCHQKHLVDGCWTTADIYQADRAKSDQAVSLAKYLIDHLGTNPVLFARACGMQGYTRKI